MRNFFCLLFFARGTDKRLDDNSFLLPAVFGNYCIQKLLDFGTPEQKETLAKTMEGNVMPLSLSTYGCRSIQKVRRRLFC